MKMVRECGQNQKLKKKNHRRPFILHLLPLFSLQGVLVHFRSRHSSFSRTPSKNRISLRMGNSFIMRNHHNLNYTSLQLAWKKGQSQSGKCSAMILLFFVTRPFLCGKMMNFNAFEHVRSVCVWHMRTRNVRLVDSHRRRHHIHRNWWPHTIGSYFVRVLDLGTHREY